MKKQEKIDTDLDVVNLAKSIEGSEKESLFYFRTEGEYVFIVTMGADYCVTHGFLVSFLKDPMLLNTISEAVARYEEETLWCKECQKAHHREEVLSGVCPDCKGKFSE